MRMRSGASLVKPVRAGTIEEEIERECDDIEYRIWVEEQFHKMKENY